MQKIMVPLRKESSVAGAESTGEKQEEARLERWRGAGSNGAWQAMTGFPSVYRALDCIPCTATK